VEPILSQLSLECPALAGTLGTITVSIASTRYFLKTGQGMAPLL